MPKLITSDALLRANIPNVLATVADEPSFFQKMTPFLDAAENRWRETVLGDDIFALIESDNFLYPDAMAAVVADAFFDAIPSLDLVLTPNGFGVVSNKNVAPASAARVASLRRSIASRRDDILCLLLRILSRDPRWRQSPQCEFFAESMIQNPADVRRINIPADKTAQTADYSPIWDEFLTLRAKAAPYEREIARRWISPELYRRLCRDRMANVSAVAEVSDLIRGVIFYAVRCDRLYLRTLDDIVDIIRKSPEEFPEWHGSETARLFSPATFNNDKNSGGYFF